MIRNLHRRTLPCAKEQATFLLEQLASKQDSLWPSQQWPRLRLDAGLNPGSKGGHGPIRYFVEEHQPGTWIKFRFTGPSGFHGFHALHLRAHDEGSILEHDLQMNASWLGWLKWHLIFRPLHDALIEDALDNAARQFGQDRKSKPYSLYVRLLRALVR